MIELPDAQIRRLRERGHVHTDWCYGRYQPCGEHHVHDHLCGSRPLFCGQREDKDLADLLAGIDRALEDSRREGYLTGREEASRVQVAMVRGLGDAVGYGNLMLIAQKIWRDKNTNPGDELTVGPCANSMVRCPCPPRHPPSEPDENAGCDWCCGSRLVTKRVLRAIEEKGNQP